MDVALMGDVEDKFIGGRIEYAVKGDGQFHHAKIRSDVTTITCGHLDNAFTNFLSEHRKVFCR